MFDVREKLKLFIEDKGLIQAAVAKKANLTPAQFSGIINKRRKFDANEMFRICEILDITPDQLRSYGEQRAS